MEKAVTDRDDKIVELERKMEEKRIEREFGLSA
jgi:hypothetical protein